MSRWNSYGICQSLLANATSLDPADEARRREVRTRNLEFAGILNRVCKEYKAAGTLNCYADGYAGFRYDFVTSDVSTRDYFHPSTNGQATIAAATWNVGPYVSTSPSTAPVAHFTLSCSGLTCSVDAGPSTDPNLPDDTLGYEWTFGDGNSSTTQNLTHTYDEAGTYTISLTVTDPTGQTDTDVGTVTLTGSATNSPPTASFTESCSGLTCDFTDASTDSDGSVVAWGWTFGDGDGSTTQNPTHTYAATGTYPVSLTVTDDDGASSTASRSVTVAEASAITLSAVGYKLKGVQYADLSWSGTTSTNVDVYRDGVLITTTPNDAAYTDRIGKKGGGSYVYKVCEAGTQTCSNEATVTF